MEETTNSSSEQIQQSQLAPEITWPSKITMTGLPRSLAGWNTTFTRINEYKEDCPVYKLEAYNYYYLFWQIKAAYIAKIGGQWKLVEDLNNEIAEIYKLGDGNEQIFPMGKWSIGEVIVD